MFERDEGSGSEADTGAGKLVLDNGKPGGERECVKRIVRGMSWTWMVIMSGHA